MIEKSHAKVNIYLKMLGTRGNYHELTSRFMRVDELYDTLTFQRKEQENETFELVGDFGCEVEKNTIYKVFMALSAQVPSIKNFFHEYKVVVEKHIPEFAGLGGGSSNAAAFLRLSNRVLNLQLNTDTLAKIGASTGADVPFFVYDYPSANVSGIGEIVEPFEEEILQIETFTPDILCDTAKVYQQFRVKYLKNIDSKSAQLLQKESSKNLLSEHDALFLNDLFAPALDSYPALKKYHDNNFFSGSGSTFFRIKHG